MDSGFQKLSFTFIGRAIGGITKGCIGIMQGFMGFRDITAIMENQTKKIMKKNQDFKCRAWDDG